MQIATDAGYRDGHFYATFGFRAGSVCTGLTVKVLGSSLGGRTRAIAATLFADISIPSRTIGSRWGGM